MPQTDSGPRLVALFSHPLVDQAGRPIAALDLERERATLWKAFCDSRAPMRVYFDVATAENVQNHLLSPDGCDWLHWSGHGAPGGLAFEDARGKAHGVSGELLADLVKTSAGRPVSFAFVSACHSEETGKALAEAGVAHVVAVELRHTVLDQAAIVFARGFYRALAVGRTVAQAFAAGKTAVATAPELEDRANEEAEKFRLLPEDGDHDVALCEGVGEGEPNDQSKPPSSHDLPARRTDFVGRALEIHRMVATLLAGDRLVTVRGAPGIGKTQAAIEAARWLAERRHFPDGIRFVDMRGATGADTIRAEVALAFETQCENDEQLAAFLRDQECLLVLDNLEDPLRADRAGVRRLLLLLLNGAPKLKVLVTSRVLIGGGVPAAERVETIPEFSLDDSAELFATSADHPLRAKAVAEDPDFLRIFEVLGGHPLSVSITAGHLATRSLREIREALEQEPDTVLEVADISEEDEPHLTSVTRSLDLSLRWLQEAEPEAVQLFGILSLLPGGAFVPTLDAVIGFEWRRAMNVLVRHSLVEKQRERYSLLPVVLIYADQCLSDEDRELCSIAALEHFADLFVRGYQSLGSKNALGWRWLLSFELPNAVACLQRPGRPAREGERLAPGPALAEAACAVCLRLNRNEEGLSAGELGRQVSREIGDRLGEAVALRALGDVCERLDDLEGAWDRHEEALGIYRETGDRVGEANALLSLGEVLRRRDDQKGAQDRYEEALGIYRETANRLGEANTLRSLGSLRYSQADLDGAEKALLEAVQTYQDIGALLGEANAHDALGRVKEGAGEPEAARAEFAAAVNLYEEIGDRYSTARTLLTMVPVLAALGGIEQAYTAVDEAARLAGEIGNEELLEGAAELRRQLKEVVKKAQQQDDQPESS